MSLYTTGDPLEHVVPHPLMTREMDLGFLTPEGVVTVLSDQIAMMIIAGLLLCVVLPLLLRRRRDRSETGSMVLPAGFANLIELICEYFHDQVAVPILGEHAGRFVKYIWSAFFFVLANNLLGIIPFGTVLPVVAHLHIGGTATGNIWVTATLAILTLILMVFNGLRYGGKAYLAHFAPGPIWMAWLMIPLEIVGTFAKIFALAVRLFANMLAGHVLLAVMISLILSAGQALGAVYGSGVAILVVLGSIFINFLEIFVAFLQAFIFTYLSTVFIGLSVNVHGDDHGQEAAAH